MLYDQTARGLALGGRVDDALVGQREEDTFATTQTLNSEFTAAAKRSSSSILILELHQFRKMQLC